MGIPFGGRFAVPGAPAAQCHLSLNYFPTGDLRRSSPKKFSRKRQVREWLLAAPVIGDHRNEALAVPREVVVNRRNFRPHASFFLPTVEAAPQ